MKCHDFGRSIKDINKYFANYKISTDTVYYTMWKERPSDVCNFRSIRPTDVQSDISTLFGVQYTNSPKGATERSKLE